LQLCTCDLAHWLADRAALSECEAAHITHQLLTALAACHSHGVVYHDVKPANLLLRSQDAASGLPHICLADFGCAHSTLGPHAGARSSPGTPLFRQAPGARFPCWMPLQLLACPHAGCLQTAALKTVLALAHDPSSLPLLLVQCP
jgi:serine/threonine protein kinase